MSLNRRRFLTATVLSLSSLPPVASRTVWGQTPPPAPKPDDPKAKKKKGKKPERPTAILETTKGRIVLELFPEEAPMTVANFLGLAKKGFYDGLTFHRAEDWVVQGGDPQGDGKGGPGYTIKSERNRGLMHLTGAVGMAISGRDTAGSQFYILKKPMPQLDNNDYTLFARVGVGQDVVEKLQVGDRMTRVSVIEPEGFKIGPSRAAEPEYTVPPMLPADAATKGYKSGVRVKVHISRSGLIRAELKRKSGNREVDEAVLSALNAWKWTPALKNGDPVDSTQEFNYDIATGSRSYGK